ncbi:hypothetical protein EalM132_00053 [Exiguobacterium phage vB_EalM-132]|nr:hypothetical protein EalM132_00053 [Exiguobacterium phage vB_EalM-132]
MTKIQIITGIVYTDLSVDEVRRYLQGGVKTNTFKGYADEAGTTPILIAVHAVEYIYL